MNEHGSKFFDWFGKNLENMPKGWGDLILDEGLEPCVVDGNGDLVKIDDAPIITRDDLEYIVSHQTSQSKEVKLDDLFNSAENNEEFMELDIAVEFFGNRYRYNFHLYGSGKIGSVGRKIENNIRPLDSIGLPTQDVLDLFHRKSGLIAFIGPTGSGKSSTMLSVLDVLSDEPFHIITIEDPIEGLLSNNKKARVRQREVGSDTNSFYSGLRAALREKPHIIVVAEIRDAKTAEAAMKAAISGHLVICTLHANTCAEAPRRIIDLFEPALQPAMRNMLADVFIAFIGQTLVKKKTGGRALAYEILNRNNDGIISNIRDGNYGSIAKDAYQGYEENKIYLMEQSLAKLYLDDIITEDEAMVNAYDKNKFISLCKVMSGKNNQTNKSFGKKI